MAQQADTSAEHRAPPSTQPSISEKAADSASKVEAMDDSLPELQGKLELTEAEQATYKRYLRKTDLRLALFICCGYMFSFLNRVALSQSKPVGVVADMHLDDVTVPLSIFYVSYLIFQVPSNIVLKHVRPSLWLSFLAAAWSVTGALGALAKSKGGIIAVRFCIGMFEAGFTSGVIAVYASWYPRDQLSRRLGWMYSSASLASMWAGPAAAGLGSIKSDVLRPYQILFIFYGCSSLVWSVVAFFMVKDYPATCSFLDGDEKAVIRKIMVQQGTLAKTGEFSRRQLYRSLLDWRIWAWSVIGFSGNITANTGPLFAPIFTVEMGFGRIAGQGMSAIPNFVSFLVSFFSGTLAQWAGSSSVLLVYAQILNIVGLVMAVATTQSAVRFVGLCIFNGASILVVPTAPGWAVSNQSGTTKTSVAAAMVSAIGAFGGFAASYMYPGRDAPRYLAGHVANIAVCAFVAVATLAMRVSLQTSNRRREKNPQDISQMTSEEIADLGDRHPNFRYRL
ncbi:MFS general substrate transporter [Linderina pennispora]|uniref:MFS general substrate transporter n=1 Tax=Linderina pennispora TaxID=61395 RepID=A0A1Y1W5G5_9FUNG|nr:MFS general substrate transporter [Linderina pennispora]ORX68642.1 MFS general substrate transporter [Linderina pennispora]